jgi:hypothetical protein
MANASVFFVQFDLLSVQTLKHKALALWGQFSTTGVKLDPRGTLSPRGNVLPFVHPQLSNTLNHLWEWRGEQRIFTRGQPREQSPLLSIKNRPQWWFCKRPSNRRSAVPILPGGKALRQNFSTLF